jgi:hypothetical protein
MARNQRGRGGRGANVSGGLAALVVVATCGCAAVANAPAFAADTAAVTQCPDKSSPPVRFEIDCSKVADSNEKQRCGAFIENQACKVFPAYRAITGIAMEQVCPSIRYAIFDGDSLPAGQHDAGGLALRCEVQYVAKYSIDVNSPIGPYDAHELLHEYQIALGALPQQHALFESSMAEARRLVGDAPGYAVALEQMRREVENLGKTLDAHAAKAADPCPLAETVTEESLYLADRQNVYAFYRKLVPSKVGAQSDREARFNRMFDTVSGGKAKSTLMARGCAPF